MSYVVSEKLGVSIKSDSVTRFYNKSEGYFTRKLREPYGFSDNSIESIRSKLMLISSSENRDNALGLVNLYIERKLRKRLSSGVYHYKWDSLFPEHVYYLLIEQMGIEPIVFNGFNHIIPDIPSEFRRHHINYNKSSNQLGILALISSKVHNQIFHPLRPGISKDPLGDKIKIEESKFRLNMTPPMKPTHWTNKAWQDFTNRYAFLQVNGIGNWFRKYYPIFFDKYFPKIVHLLSKKITSF